MTPSRKHLLTGLALAGFATVFAAFLGVAAYYYFAGDREMTMESFAPGAPALFLGFLARNQFRSYRAARKHEDWKRRRAGRENGPLP